jgi:hypothetical protein
MIYTYLSLFFRWFKASNNLCNKNPPLPYAHTIWGGLIDLKPISIKKYQFLERKIKNEMNGFE